MKTSFAKVAGGLALLAASSAAMASVVNTAHNLGASNLSGGNFNTNTTEICVFCHTPHGGDQTAFAPLWNRSTQNSNGYTRFSDLNRLTFDAAEAPVGSVSAACLSCHDGTQAMNAIINTPGSNTNGLWTGGGGAGWSETSTSGQMSDLSAPNGYWNGTYTASHGSRGDMIYLGTDLSNDHPISMAYGGGNITQTTPAALTKDPDFAQPFTAMGINGTVTAGHAGGLFVNDTTTFPGEPSNAAVNNTVSDGSGGIALGTGTGAVAYSISNGVPRWWVETGGAASYDSHDFPLYTRSDLSVAGVQPTVECGTCHDPHSGNSTFLRLVGGNRGSQVCLTCHAK